MLLSNYQALMENVFEMQGGYVLNFKSKKEFQSIVAETVDIDIMNDAGYHDQPSMAKKLRYFVGHEDDQKVSKLLLKLLELRTEWMARRTECDEEFMDRFPEAATKLKLELQRMQGVAQIYSTDNERFNADMLLANKVLLDLHEAIGQLLNNHSINYSKSENEINDYLRDLLIARGYHEAADQTRHGDSLNEKDAGMVDLLLRKNGKESVLIEALKLECINQKYISDHIVKATMNYNPLGTSTIILAYVKTENLINFWRRYVDYLRNYDFNMEIAKAFEELTAPNASAKEGYIVLKKNDYAFPVFFVVVKL